MTTKLDAYLTDAKMTNAEFAKRVDASEATISRIRNGKQTASADLIQRIVNETRGAVMPNDFFEIPDEAQAGAAA